MEFPGFDRYLTGILVPVSSLRSTQSMGVGEFADLIPLSDWCRESGLDLIQILPVNDSGFQNSPYSAVSAFALHPIYLRIEDLPELSGNVTGERSALKKIQNEISAVRSEFEPLDRVPYRQVLERKLEILRTIYREFQTEITADAEIRKWTERNPWIREFAVYRTLKDRHEGAAWIEWDEYRDPTVQGIEAFWSDPAEQEKLWFYVWLQYRLEGQLTAVATALSERGIYLKGDLPILMNEDSVDIWAHRDIFIPELRAGAPPDVFSRLGQNWDFPVYDWDALAGQNHDWWKRRLVRADRFYHAYRIDHVLGFFRIWAIPSKNSSGTMGYFYPSYLITREELHQAGFDDGRIRWLSEPHITARLLVDTFGERAPVVTGEVFSRIGNESLFLFQDRIAGEKDIHALDLEQTEKSVLLDWFRDRALISVTEDSFAPAWEYLECRRYQSLGGQEKVRFQDLIERATRGSEKMWEEQGRRLLSFMNGTVPMLTCAEDLGVIPESVPRTLEDLGILGMRVPRWARRYNEPEEPFIPPSEYRFLTVCASSVHDTSTLREWWDEDDGREAFWHSLGYEKNCPQAYDATVAGEVIAGLLQTGSALCVFQIQDMFALDRGLVHEDPKQDRVNIPGTYNEFNWSYRMPITLEELSGRGELAERIRKLVSRRRARKVS